MGEVREAEADSVAEVREEVADSVVEAREAEVKVEEVRVVVAKVAEEVGHLSLRL